MFVNYVDSTCWRANERRTLLLVVLLMSFALEQLVRG